MKTSPSLVVETNLGSTSNDVAVQPREFKLIAAFLPDVLKEFARIQSEQQKD